MLLTPLEAGAAPRLDDEAARPPAELARRKDLREEVATLTARMKELQARLWAERQRALLVVLQARDAGGKDGVIRHVFGPLNPQGCIIHPFDVPCISDLQRDFLWRVHQVVPRKGEIAVFNRSHYEDVLVARVRELVPVQLWSKRFDQINDFERLLAETGTVVLKFFLHVSHAEQEQRLLKRLRNPKKNWKFRPEDLKDRDLWEQYTEAYHDALLRCNTPWAPWYVVPADDKPVRDYLVANVVLHTLEQMDPRFPTAAPEVEAMRAQLG